MSHKYPRIVNSRYLKDPQICKICGQKGATRIIEVEWNIFRGDDDRYCIHDHCVSGVFSGGYYYTLYGEKKYIQKPNEEAA